MDISKYIDWVKLSPKHLTSILIATSLILFGPLDLLKKIGLDKILDDFKLWVGLIWIDSLSLLMVYPIEYLIKLGRKKFMLFVLIESRKKRMNSLTPKEKDILRSYLENDSRTQAFPIQDGAVIELCNESILSRVSDIGYTGSYLFPFNIEPWAWNYLKNNSDLLDELSSVKSENKNQ